MFNRHTISNLGVFGLPGNPYLEVSYTPVTPAVPVPTMTPAGLALLAILLGGLTVYALRKPHGATGGN